MVGYSGTPLPQKLGIKPGHRLALLAAPKGFADDTLGPLSEVTVAKSLAGTKPFDVVVLFVTEKSALLERYDHIVERLADAGGFWVAWPKKASKVATDVTEDVVRDLALARGLVDNKVCAIDEVWSGLRLVRRLKDRKK